MQHNITKFIGAELLRLISNCESRVENKRIFTEYISIKIYKEKGSCNFLFRFLL